MVPTFNTDDFIRATNGKVFTLSEAFEIMEILGMIPTGDLSIKWIDSVTKNRVILGSSDISNKKVEIKRSPVPSGYYKKHK